MTQKERILNSLKAAGGLGVRSDVYIRDFMPRAAARIQELRDEGWDISSERDGKFVIWRLENVGVGAEKESPDGPVSSLSTDSGVADSVTPLTEAPPAGSPYDPFEEWAA